MVQTGILEANKMKRFSALLILLFALTYQVAIPSYNPLTGGKASVFNRIVLSQDTTTNLGSLTNSEGAFYYDTTINLPSFDDGSSLIPLVDNQTAQTLTNKSFSDSTTSIIDEGDNTKIFKFQASGITTGTTRTATIPDSDFTFTGNALIQTLTNKSIDADSNTLTNIDNDEIKASAGIARSKLASGTADYVVINDGSGLFSEEQYLSKSRGGTGADSSSVTFPSTGTILTEAGVQDVSNKDIDGGTASNDNRITIPKNTKTNLDGLTRKEATLTYATDESKLYVDDGATLIEVGSGGSASSGTDATINAIDNFGAELNADGYSAYADAAGLSPVDGTGGSPTVTIARNTTTPLIGSGDLVLTKDAADRQGEGASYDFTIDSAQKSKVQTVSFYYSTSVNFDYGTAGDASDPSDVVVYVYDVTNTEVIQLVPYTLDGSGKFTGTFQASGDSTSYRLIFHVAGTNASAWTMNIDNIAVGPQSVAKGAIYSYLGSCINTGSWTSNTTYSSHCWRNGNKLKVDVTVNLSGTPNASNLTITIPYTIDSSVVSSASTTNINLGKGNIFDSGVGSQPIFVGYNNTTSVAVYHDTASSTPPSFTATSDTSPITFANGDKVHIEFEVPIQGWESTTVLSTDSGNMVVVSKAYLGSNQNVTSTSETIIVFNNSSFEKGISLNTSTGVVTINEAGFYDVDFCLYLSAVTADENFEMKIKQNTSTPVGNISIQSSGTAASGCVPAKIQANSGDTLSATVTSSSDTNYNVISGLDTTRLEISKIQSPQTIGQSEKVEAIFSSDAGQSIPDSTVTILDFEDIEKDTHGQVTTGASWKFTASQSGTYTANVFIQMNADNNWEANEQMRVMLYKNGSEEKRIDLKSMSATLTNYTMTVGGSASIDLVAGDEINFRVLQNSDAAISINNGSSALAHGSIVKQ